MSDYDNGYADGQATYVDRLEEMTMQRALDQKRIAELKAALQVAKDGLEEIAGGMDCGCCRPGDAHCDTGTARDTLEQISHMFEED